jgi:hypothetical protein
MNYLKFTPYLYLIIGIYLIYDGISNLNNPTETPELRFIFAALAIFMFFFRRKYAQRFEERNKKL